jgi:hypothetical protein
MKSQPTEVQDIYLEQAAVGDLPPEELEALRRRRGYGAADLDRAIDDIRIKNDTFHRRFDKKATLDSIRARAFAGDPAEERISAFARDIKNGTAASGDGRRDDADRSRFISRMPRWSLALAAALPVFFAMALLLRIGPMTDPASGGLEPGVRTKGLEPRIFIYRDMGDGDIELLQNNDAVRANDTLQISYLATGQNYGAILSIDGSSVITLHYPENSNMLPRLQPQDEVYLPYGYLLDDAPDFERFIFVTSEEAFDVRQLMASIAPQLRGSAWLDQGMLEFPEDFDVYRVDLIKPRGTR